jgi:S1-C subfamily serine protease
VRRLRAPALAAACVLAVAGGAAAQDWSALFHRASPSVVVIRAKGREVQTQGVVRVGEVGSGVLVSADGKVVTAAHVVHTMEEITAQFIGSGPVPARVVASEPAADLSLLQLDSVPPGAVPARIADSNLAQVGDDLFVIGAPYGLSYALSQGVVSARWEPNTVTREFPLAEFIQTNAAINTGNSGGPVFNMAGEVLGIVSHLISQSGGSQGLGFVVSSNSVKRLVLERRPVWHGMDGTPVSGTTAELLNVPPPGGLLVRDVVKGSLAERIGLRGGTRLATIEGQPLVVGGDVILSVQGAPVATDEERRIAREALARLRPGDGLRLTVLRAGRVVELGVTIPRP